jgi:hypothetical protein
MHTNQRFTKLKLADCGQQLAADHPPRRDLKTSVICCLLESIVVYNAPDEFSAWNGLSWRLRHIPMKMGVALTLFATYAKLILPNSHA